MKIHSRSDLLILNVSKYIEFKLSTSSKGLMITKRFASQQARDTSKQVLKNLPTGKRWPLVGSLPSLIAAGSSPKLHLYVHAKHSQLGPIFREYGLGTSLVFLADPGGIRDVFAVEGKYPEHFLPDAWTIYNKINNIKRGLLFMNGEEWWHYRRILNQIIMKDSFVQSLAPVHKVVVDNLLLKWSSSNYINDLEKDLYIHSLSFMLSTSLGSSYPQKVTKYVQDLEELGQLYQEIFASTSQLMLLPVKLAKALGLQVWKHFCSVMDKSLQASEAFINKMMNDAADDGLLKKLKDAGLDEKIIACLLIDLMIAAGDTTSYTTQWALYLIGQEHASTQIIYPVKGIVKEALRLYPAAPFLTRVISQPLDILGYHLKQGELIIMSMYTCGRTEEYFPNAGNFVPSRWQRHKEGFEGVRNATAFLPFAMGSRSCVGRKLAEAQLNLTISSILQAYELKTTKKVEMILRLTPAPSEPIKLSLQKRQFI